MIVSAPGPLDPRPGGLRTLYVALNSPVVTLAALPVGPATALVAVHEPPAAGATLAVCSARTGTVAFYTASDPAGGGPDDATGADLAAETALSFAESLGFLFDEALRPSEAPAEVLARWQAWAGDTAYDDAPSAPGAGPRLPADAAPPLGSLLSKFRLPLSAAAGDGVERVVAATLRRAGPLERSASDRDGDPGGHAHDRP